MSNQNKIPKISDSDSYKKKIDKIIPKCVKGDRVTMGHSALGFLLPCCWCDGKAFQRRQLTKEHEALYSDHLHLDKVKDIKEITHSKEWKAFWDIMFDDPNNAAFPCKTKCGVVGDDLRNWSKQEEYHYDLPGQPVTKKDNNKGYVGS